MFGMQVDRSNLLWRKLSQKQRAVVTVAASMLLTIAVWSAFAYLAVSQASGSSQAGDYVSIGTWSCNNDGLVPLASIDSVAPAADGRGVAVQFSNVGNGSRVQCVATHTNSSASELLCVSISPASMFGGDATTDTATTPSLAPLASLPRGFRINFGAGTGFDETYASEDVTMNWTRENQGATPDGDCSTP